MRKHLVTHVSTNPKLKNVKLVPSESLRQFSSVNLTGSSSGPFLFHWALADFWCSRAAKLTPCHVLQLFCSQGETRPLSSGEPRRAALAGTPCRYTAGFVKKIQSGVCSPYPLSDIVRIFPQSTIRIKKIGFARCAKSQQPRDNEGAAFTQRDVSPYLLIPANRWVKLRGAGGRHR